MRTLIVPILLFVSASSALAADHAAVARASLIEIIRPGYAAFAEHAGGLEAKLAALCDTPSEAALKSVRGTFAATTGAWSKVEIFRFGPVIEDHRYERIFFWPHPKEGLGLKQLRRALPKKGQALTIPEELDAKSVALQGLPSLEYLLYGDGAEALAETKSATPGGQMPKIPSDAEFRCDFAVAVATNVHRIAKNRVEE